MFIHFPVHRESSYKTNAKTVLIMMPSARHTAIFLPRFSLLLKSSAPFLVEVLVEVGTSEVVLTTVVVLSESVEMPETSPEVLVVSVK